MQQAIWIYWMLGVIVFGALAGGGFYFSIRLRSSNIFFQLILVIVQLFFWALLWPFSTLLFCKVVMFLGDSTSLDFVRVFLVFAIGTIIVGLVAGFTWIIQRQLQLLNFSILLFKWLTAFGIACLISFVLLLRLTQFWNNRFKGESLDTAMIEGFVADAFTGISPFATPYLAELPSPVNSKNEIIIVVPNFDSLDPIVLIKSKGQRAIFLYQCTGRKTGIFDGSRVQWTVDGQFVVCGLASTDMTETLIAYDFSTQHAIGPFSINKNSSKPQALDSFNSIVQNLILKHAGLQSNPHTFENILRRAYVLWFWQLPENPNKSTNT